MKTFVFWKLNDVGVEVDLSNGRCKMVQGYMVLDKGIYVGNLLHLDACLVQCDSSSIYVVKRSTKCTHLSPKSITKGNIVSTYDGHAL